MEKKLGTLLAMFVLIVALFGLAPEDIMGPHWMKAIHLDRLPWLWFVTVACWLAFCSVLAVQRDQDIDQLSDLEASEIWDVAKPSIALFACLAAIFAATIVLGAALSATYNQASLTAFALAGVAVIAWNLLRKRGRNSWA